MSQTTENLPKEKSENGMLGKIVTIGAQETTANAGTPAQGSFSAYNFGPENLNKHFEDVIKGGN